MSFSEESDYEPGWVTGVEMSLRRYEVEHYADMLHNWVLDLGALDRLRYDALSILRYRVMIEPYTLR
jgi:hypothetical protein